MRVKTEEKRQAIIAVATEVFRAKGYSEASMAEISARLGGSKGTLYSYFASKEELFSAVMLDMGRRLADPVFGELERTPDGRTALKRFARRLVHVLCSPEVLDFRRMIAGEGVRSGIGKLCYENSRGMYKSKFTEFFRAQIAAGVFRDADPRRASMHLEGLCSSGPAQDLLEGVIDRVTDREINAAADAATDVFLRAYAVSDA